MRWPAVFLDLDGTIIDSEPMHVLAHRTFLARHGVVVPDARLYGNIGKGDRFLYRDLMDEHGITGADPVAWVRDKTAVMLELMRGGVALRPGIHALLDRCAREGIAVQVVTSAERDLATLALTVTGLAPRLPVRVCHEDVAKRKPHPDPYLLAAMRLGMPPARCLVVEDSPAGVTAGRAAGMNVIGYPGHVSAEVLTVAGAQATISALDQALDALR